MENSQLARHRQALIQTSTVSAIIAQYFSITSIFYDRVNFPRPPRTGGLCKSRNNSLGGEFAAPEPCARLRTVEIAIKVSNRRDLLSFAGGLCFLFLWAAARIVGIPYDRRNILRFRASGSTKSRDYILMLTG
jgi:hypothetical protein